MLATYPAFGPYALTAALLSVHLLVLWQLTGAARGKSKTTPNEEDAATILKNAKVQQEEPVGVLRARRVFDNAQANTIPFLILGLVYVLLGASPTMAWAVFGSYSAARIGHSVFYTLAKQPWRSLAFIAAQCATFTLVILVVRAAVAG
jgi:glutathione S-transferase